MKSKESNQQEIFSSQFGAMNKCARIMQFPLNIFASLYRMAEVVSEQANLRETPSSASEVKLEVAEGTGVRVWMNNALGMWFVQVKESDGCTAIH
jgi:hypothetical protein